MDMFAELSEATKPDLEIFPETGTVKKESQKEDPLKALEVKTKNLKVEPAFKITTEIEYEIGLSKLKELTKLNKEVHTLCDPVCDAANKAHKEATGLRSKLLKPITTVKEAYQKAIGAYDFKKEQDQKAIAAKLEKARQDKIDTLKLENAEKLEKEGKPEEAQAVLDLEIEIAPIIVEKVKTEGVQYRDNWQVEIFDKKKIPIEYMNPDISALTKHAKEKASLAKKNNTEVVSDIAGVKFVNLRKAIV